MFKIAKRKSDGKLAKQVDVNALAMIYTVVTIGLFCLLTVVPTLAVGPAEIVTNILQGIGKVLTTIFSPLCVLIVAIAIIGLVLGRDPKSSATYYAWIKRTIVCFVVFNVIGSLFTWGEGLIIGEGLTQALQ